MELVDAKIHVGLDSLIIQSRTSPVNIILEKNDDLVGAIQSFETAESEEQVPAEFISFVKQYFDLKIGILGVHWGHHVFLDINLTDNCNLSCKHCIRGARKSEEIGLRKIESLLTSLPHGFIYMANLSGGEPTVHPEFLDIVNLFASKGIPISFITNGQNQDITRSNILEDIASVAVSIDGFRERHDSIRGKGTFDRAMTFLDACVRKEIFVCVNCVAYGQEIDYFQSFADLMIKHGASEVRFLPLQLEGNACSSGQDDLDQKRNIDELTSSLLKRYHNSSNKPLVWHCDQDRYKCSAYYGKMIHMRQNGKLYLCRKLGEVDAFELELNDLLREPVEYLSKTNPFAVYYDNPNNALRCKNCAHGDKCKDPCRALAIKSKENACACTL